jgi:ADP-heptose:LPS heptosyltransferase
MHVAAALGKPIVCFFGNSDATLWRPWGVPYALLQPGSRDVADVSVDQALAAFGSLGAEATAAAG